MLVKIFIASLMLIFGLGCSKFEINTTVCDEIDKENPREQVPQECRNYNKEEAYRAFDKATKSNQQSSEDLKFDGQVNGE